MPVSEMTAIQSDRAKAAAILGPYIMSCYEESHHCDLLLISSDNKGPNPIVFQSTLQQRFIVFLGHPLDLYVDTLY